MTVPAKKTAAAKAAVTPAVIPAESPAVTLNNLLRRRDDVNRWGERTYYGDNMPGVKPEDIDDIHGVALLMDNYETKIARGKADISAIGSALKLAANRRGYCEEFETEMVAVMDKVSRDNRETFRLAVNRKQPYNVVVTFRVEALNNYEARNAIHILIGERARYGNEYRSILATPVNADNPEANTDEDMTVDDNE